MEPPRGEESFQVFEAKEKIMTQEGAMVEEKFKDDELSMVMEGGRKIKE